MIEMRERPSNCAFGESDLKTLFITSGSNIYRGRFDAN
jgi:sugar lactone lactonase YvrE